MKCYSISPITVFKVSFTFNLISVIWNIIGDCDETYNYWEPLHFLIFNKGFQTWEYSPQFALRSYLFLWIYGWPAILLKWLFVSVSKYVLFYTIRLYMVIVISLLEVYLYKSLNFFLEDEIVSVYCVFFFVFSAGSFISITAFLPSSFAMFCSIFAVSSWLRGNYNAVIGIIACSAIVGWPFSAAIGIPFAIDIIIKKGFFYFIRKSILWGVLLSAISVAYDTFLYGSLSFPSLNIVKYNVFNTHGPELYGTESWSFYVKNYLLNFNFCVILCALHFVIVTAKLVSNFSFRGMRLEIIILSIFGVWNIIFFSQPHKEERFLFPCYPFLAISCGICLRKVQLFFSPSLKTLKEWVPFGKSLIHDLSGFILLIIFALISLSRIISIVMSFNGSMTIYHHLNEVPNADGKVLCLGREWHRFPSNFLVANTNMNVSFIKSDFRGQLPGKFTSLRDVYSTNVHFNDLNEEEPDRYVHFSECNFIIDRIGLPTDNEPNWEESFSSYWSRRVTLYLLNPATVGTKLSPFRSFYIPFLSHNMNDFVDYVLFERV